MLGQNHGQRIAARRMECMRLMSRASVPATSLVDDCCFVTPALSAAASPPGCLPAK